MSALLFAGAGAGAGLFVVTRALMPRPVSLTTSLQRLDRTGESVHERQSHNGTARPASAPSRWIASTMRGRLGRRIEADLAVLDRSADRLAIEKVSTALALGAIAAGLMVVMQLAHAHLSPGLASAIVVAALAVGFVTPDIAVRSRAAARRGAFRQALSSYLDLVNVLLAGGAGIETSLEAAAEAGDGWAFNQIRHALVRARALRTSPWECFSDLGERLGVEELGEVAASVKLAGQQGARVKLSLAAKASALRAHQMARIEADAQAATERMGLPTVLMFVGFMILLGYPAMQQIVRAF